MSGTNVSISPSLSGWYAAPAGGARGPGVVVLMEAYGITAHIRGVCERLAAAGFPALAPDLYHGKLIGYDDMQSAIAAIRELDDGKIIGEIGESLDWLDRQPAVLAGKAAVFGFCMGGRLAFLSGCRHAARLGALVSFYGGSIAPEGEKDRLGRNPPIGEAAALKAPLLLTYGGADQGIPPAEHARLAARLGELGKRYVLSVYPGAGHGFCCEERPAYAQVAADAAFAEAFDFLRRAFA
jgi:carboxymethylenebutenolidase